MGETDKETEVGGGRGGLGGGREGERDIQIYRDDDQYTNLYE